MYRTCLTLAGYDVEEAADGLAALNAIDSNPPDLVVLDLMLPTVSGFVVQQDVAARSHTRHIPIVIVTGSHDEIVQKLDVPCVLTKPVSPDEVLEAVRRCLAAGHKQQEIL